MEKSKSMEVFLIKTNDRKFGIKKLFEQFNLKDYYGKTIALKANFNSADPFPASTHIDTLENIVKILKEIEVKNIVLAERSGMGKTREVLEEMNVFNLSKKLGFKVVVLDEESKDKWVKIKRNGTHWLNGFYISKIFLNADKVIQTCCLKTHRFGGHFTMSLKNSVGIVAKRIPKGLYDYMAELHTSPFQRLMIAEVNKFYKVDLVIMDAIEAFSSGGPDRGELIKPNLILASKDRVAIDAVGVAILRSYGSTKEVMKGRIFELEQIKRAAEINIGVKSASDIKLIPLNNESIEIANKLENILKEQG
ncbi:MAG: DUF362 domain-containing protein [Nitrososphaerota archaeon]